MEKERHSKRQYMISGRGANLSKSQQRDGSMMGIKEFLNLPCLAGAQGGDNDSGLRQLKQRVPMIQPPYNTKQTCT